MQWIFLFASLTLSAASTLSIVPPDETDAVRVVVPNFQNTTCPIMGKPASAKLFTDTPLGRIYVCCAPCIKKIRADVALSERAAYPSAQRVGNKVCPVNGQSIEEGSPTVTLQGLEISLSSEDCIEAARKSIQVTLLKATNPRVVEVHNGTCPVSGEVADAETVVLIGDSIVHLSSYDHLAELEAQPVQMLSRAKEIAAREAARRASQAKHAEEETRGKQSR